MKKTIYVTLILILSSCSSQKPTAPSQNSALNSLTSVKKERKTKGVMQTELDDWLKNDWTPTVEQNKTIKARNADQNRSFKLQDYVDKIKFYRNNSDSEK